MKRKLKTKILTIMISLAMAFTMMPMMGNPAYAKGNSPSIVKSGDSDNFTKDAPITTVRLDKDKFTKANAILDSKNDYYKWGTGEDPQTVDSVWTSEVTVPKTKNEDGSATEGQEISLPSFSITLKEAAIMRDATKIDLKVTFDDVKVFTKGGMDEYTDFFRIVSLSSNDKTPGIDISPASSAANHFGLQAKVTCQVVGAAADDTLLLVAAELNNARSGLNTFERIKGAADNFNYSESMQFLSGIDSESDIYLMNIDNYSIDTDPSETTDVSGYNVRFVGNGKPTASHTNSSLATVVSASAAGANVWSSAGNAPQYPIHMFCISPLNAPGQFTSSSGEGGKIELWTDGLTHNTDSEARKLAGGTISDPYTYAVPYGKEVTYRMTPEEGYLIDRLYVNGDEVDLEDDPFVSIHRNSAGDIDYYEYHFGDNTVNSNQEIGVTWKKYTATTDPIPVRKLVTGNVPDKDQEFTVLLEQVPESDAPADGPVSSNVDRITVNVSKGQTEGASEIPGLMFKKPGEYAYNVRELKGSVAGYTYADKVYTVKFVIEPDQWDTDILICTKQTILDGNKEVEVCEFMNNYRPVEPGPTPGGVSGMLLAKATAKGRTNLVIGWNRINGADGYDIFFARCNHNGKKIVSKKVKSIKGNNIFKWTKSGLKRGTAYKSYVRAYVMKDGKKKYISKSPIMHAYTGNVKGKYTNAKAVKVNKTRVTLKKGKTFKIKAKVTRVKRNKKLFPGKHVKKLRYRSSNTKVATVTGSGRIIARGSGTCTIVAFAHNGLSKGIKVVVK